MSVVEAMERRSRGAAWIEEAFPDRDAYLTVEEEANLVHAGWAVENAEKMLRALEAVKKECDGKADVGRVRGIVSDVLSAVLSEP